MSDKAEKALTLFNNGFNCSQSVIGAFCEQFGMNESLALKLAGGFGGGIRCGEVCGAVSGAVMVIGLKYGHYIINDMASKDNCSKITSDFMKKFNEKKNTVICRELLGYDIRNTEDKAKFPGKQKEVCPNAIETAVLLLEEMGF
jgi:C_GCAxxG_C_C family probable redox protein